jgi:hypothetical protein
MAGLHVPLSTLRHHPRGSSTHDLGPPWIATPSMSGVLIPFLMPVYPGAFPTFRVKAADQARVASMPGTIWPGSGHPPDSSWDNPNAPVSMPSRFVSTPQQRFACARLPGPYLTPLPAPFPHRSPRTAFGRRSMRRFEASPRRATPKGHNLHLPRSTASAKISYLSTSLSAFVAHWGAETLIHHALVFRGYAAGLSWVSSRSGNRSRVCWSG